MIVSYERLPEFSRHVAMVDGGFDPLHGGHIAYFHAAAALGLPLLCNVQSDRYLREAKGRPPLLPEAQRAAVIDALKGIVYTHVCTTTTAAVLAQLKPATYIKGADWQHRGLPATEVEVCEQNGIEMVYLDTILDSSTRLTRRFLQEASVMNGHQVTVQAFEAFLFNQQGVAADSYDQQYFQGHWRRDDNAYSIAKRRAIEARNPQNIKDVFQPHRVLDVGCGPGALMLFLHELGVEAWGIDISPAARAAAPRTVRGRIVLGSATEHQDLGMDFDLIICREVLEHLTVLQIRQAVKVLAQYTTKFLYLTTRFHPAPQSLLDVTNDFANDPTHITAMNKDFLRVLFLLEGLRSRPDLEQHMDWKNLGRVMVFER
jgi:glycerol-3-phosphate cytidylyltransferase